MHSILSQLVALLDRQQRVAYCRLIETRGSTPQKAGALMLVYPDGRQEGTLGGGCVEAEVKRQALTVLNQQQPQVIPFQLDHDYGWDDGLICGGRMQVLVDPLATADSCNYVRTLAAAVGSQEGCTEAIAFDAKSGVPAASIYLFDGAGQLLAQCGPAAVPPPGSILAALRPLDGRPLAYAAQGVGYLPHLPRCRLLIVGAGHVGQMVGQWAAELDFDVSIFDDREEYANAARFPRAAQIQVAPFRALADLRLDANTYCLIVTRGHNHDEQALHYLIDRGAAYIGMIGSRRKIKLIFEDLASAGVSSEALSRVFAPVGIDIGSQTVPEIAVSILAELVAHRNRGGQVPGRPQTDLVSAGADD